jgi:uncharacterized protein
MKKIISIPKYVLLGLILLYQKTLSLDHGPLKVFYPYGYCRFYPTCSEYSRQAVVKYGAIRGVKLSIVRLLKCHPYNEPKVDMLV